MPSSTGTSTARRGPRGDLNRGRIKEAARAQLERAGAPAGLSLRLLARELGVAPNAIYTYYPDLNAVLHDVADDVIGEVRPLELLDWSCPRCALVELMHRAQAIWERPWTVALMNLQPVMGVHSFELSETTMRLCAGATISQRDAHDLVHGWFFGSASLRAGGWEFGTDAIRLQGRDADRFPLVFSRPDPDPDAQFAVILHGLGLECRDD